MIHLADPRGTSMIATILPFPRAVPADAQMREPSATSADESSPPRPGELNDGDRWAAWMLQAQDGDRAAYHTLLQALTPYLRSITRRYLGRGEDAEDALQEVLMVVHGIRHTYERGRPFKPWLNTIASRRCIDLLRRRAHRLRHESGADIDSGQYPHELRGPDETVLRQHEAASLHRAVAALPERQREAILLLRLNELSLNEAAAHSEQSIGSLKVACHRALKALQRAMAKKDQHHD